jgi:hypothetical protein
MRDMPPNAFSAYIYHHWFKRNYHVGGTESPDGYPNLLTNRASIVSAIATPLLGYIGALLTLRLIVHAIGALGTSPQRVYLLEDGVFVALAMAAALALTAALLTHWVTRRNVRDQRRMFGRALAIATGWAYLCVAVFERSRTLAIAEGSLVLASCCALAMRKQTGAPQFHPLSRRQVSAALACAILALSPPRFIERPVSTHQLSRLLKESSDIPHVEKLRGWIRAANESGVLADGAELEHVARTLIDKSTRNDTPFAEICWETAVEAVNYRWALEAARWKDAQVAAADATLDSWGNLKVDVLREGQSHDGMPAELAPLNSDPEKSTSARPAQFRIGRARGVGAVILDGWRMRQVIFARTPVAYDGGPVELDAVSFPQCHIYVSRTAAGRSFLEATAAGVPVHFHYSISR